MIVIGLTGGIGMGKSTVAAQLAALGAKVCNADAVVHRLLATNGAAVDSVGRSFPGVVKGGAVDRKALGAIVFHDKEKMQMLEHILHPLVVAEENAFVETQRRLGAKLVVLDIPLLFETGAEQRCDMVIVVSAPPFIQKQRVLRRPNMNAEKLAAIIASQLPDRGKRKRADVVVATGLGKAFSFRRLQQVMKPAYFQSGSRKALHRYIVMA